MLKDRLSVQADCYAELILGQAYIRLRNRCAMTPITWSAK
jgi:hypothetical protein